MSLLSDYGLAHALAQGDLRLHPGIALNGIQPASIDLRLGSSFLEFPEKDAQCVIDTADETEMEEVIVEDGEPYRLAPFAFALGHTLESVVLSRQIAAQVDGKSTLGRVGLSVHSTAGWIDPGFSGHLTLELFNASPRWMLLWPGKPVCQLIVHRLSSTSTRAYGDETLGSKYQYARGAGASKGIGRHSFTGPLDEQVVVINDHRG